ncbi:bacterial extracellular solute-binding protein, family 3 domain-containing protein [Ditylenchus destructor]|nr:bacterial extracellular solute-binding protein, family 3 domain-containing protein [Ditylenchus destructor]
MTPRTDPTRSPDPRHHGLDAGRGPCRPARRREAGGGARRRRARHRRAQQLHRPQDPRDRRLRGRSGQGHRRQARRQAAPEAAGPGAARIPELQGGQVDILAASLTHNKEREAVIDFSLTTFVRGPKGAGKEGQRHPVAGPARRQEGRDRQGRHAGGPTCAAPCPPFEVVTFDTGPQAFQALQQGKGVAFVNDEVSLLDRFAKLGAASGQKSILPTNLSVDPLGAGDPQGGEGLKAQIDAALRELEASGAAHQLFVKWYGPHAAEVPVARFQVRQGTKSRAEPCRPFTWPRSCTAISWIGSPPGCGFPAAHRGGLAAGPPPLGGVVALMRLSPWRPLAALAWGYVELVRNIPLLALCCSGTSPCPSCCPRGARSGSTRAKNEAVAPRGPGPVVYTTAYLAEDIRSGLRSVPQGQWLAARSLGMGWGASLRWIVLPQALRVTVPPLISQTLSLWKNTSIASVIGTAELMTQAQGGRVGELPRLRGPFSGRPASTWACRC